MDRADDVRLVDVRNWRVLAQIGRQANGQRNKQDRVDHDLAHAKLHPAVGLARLGALARLEDLQFLGK